MYLHILQVNTLSRYIKCSFHVLVHVQLRTSANKNQSQNNLLIVSVVARATYFTADQMGQQYDLLSRSLCSLGFPSHD